jgi:hypothetical protein
MQCPDNCQATTVNLQLSTRSRFDRRSHPVAARNRFRLEELALLPLSDQSRQKSGDMSSAFSKVRIGWYIDEPESPGPDEMCLGLVQGPAGTSQELQPLAGRESSLPLRDIRNNRG